jgi:hypothetical protein
VSAARHEEAAMSEPIAPRVSARLRRLPGQLVLALINATAILVIAAAILALVAMGRIDRLAGRVAETMTDAVLAKAGGLPKGALAELPRLRAELQRFGDALRERKLGENAAVQAEAAQLREALAALRTSIDRLASARSALTGLGAVEALAKLRGCAAAAGETPERPIRSSSS